MRTNITLNDELLKEIFEYCPHLRTKQALVDFALKTLAELLAKQRRADSFRKRLSRIHDELQGTRMRTSVVDLIKADRNR